MLYATLLFKVQPLCEFIAISFNQIHTVVAIKSIIAFALPDRFDVYWILQASSALHKSRKPTDAKLDYSDIAVSYVSNQCMFLQLGCSSSILYKHIYMYSWLPKLLMDFRHMGAVISLNLLMYNVMFPH